MQNASPDSRDPSRHACDNDDDSPSGEDQQRPLVQRNGKVTLKERLKHFTFAWFACSMATGGVATVLSTQPNTFPGLQTIGKIIFIFDIVLFLAFTAAITARFVIHRGTFSAAIKHPTEALFIPTFFLSAVDILNCAQAYGQPATGPWLVVVLRVLFWMYLACSLCLSTAHYLYLFSAPPKRLTIQSMTPSWLLPIFPAMLCGTFASEIASTQPPGAAAAIIVAGVSMQGLGWMIAFLMCSAYIQRLMQHGLPAPSLRPGMFIAVGPPSFTGLALIGMSQALPMEYGYFAANPGSAEVLRTMALFISIFLWTFGFFFFAISLVATLLGVKDMHFNLVWYALVFPNVGFTIAIIYIGEQLLSPGIQWLGSVMTIVLVAVWLFVLGMHVKAVVTRQIMMPGADEDKEQYQDDDNA